MLDIAEHESDLDANELSRLLPPTSVLACGRIGGHEHDLYPEEYSCIAAAVPKRKSEFAAGRFYARRALAKLGRPRCAIPVGTTREPIWPAGITGSITHDGDFAVATAALRNDIQLMGIDLASGEPLDTPLVEMICTRNEIAETDKLRHLIPDHDPFKIIFSLKEALYKCLFPAIGKIFDFTDATALLLPQSNSALLSLVDRSLCPRANVGLHARYCFSGNYIFTVVWLGDTACGD